MLHQHEKLVLDALSKGAKTIGLLSSSTKLNKDALVHALLLLEEKKAVVLSREKKTAFSLTKEGTAYSQSLLPELRLIAKAKNAPAGFSSLQDDEKSIGLPWALKNGWVKVGEGKEGKQVVATEVGAKIDLDSYGPMFILRRAAAGSADPGNPVYVEQLVKRGLLIARESTEITGIDISPEGERLLADPSAASASSGEVNQLTKDLIVSGGWRNAAIRRYDSKTPVEKVYPGKKHPLRVVIDRMREIFIEMGCEEMEDNLVESSFWNFDALFQPQDHPARELADTFYLSAPAKIPVPLDEKLVERVKKAHQKGWNYRWSPEVAGQAVLRTHDTAVSPKYLAAIGRGEKKAPTRLFSLGRVYRNESTDYKHLAEFHQVGGIVVDEDANFRDLLGVIKEFFKKLGFEKTRFRPSFFPYTEPSLEVEVYYEPKKEWMELGGAGIFRPEVCLPLWGKYPVIAWGLSLERPTMMMMGLDDIRMFYKNDLDWLRECKAGSSWV